MTNLLEGRGIAARETIKDDGSGAIFTNDKGESIELYDVVYFPADGGKFEDDPKGTENPVKGRDKSVAAVADWMKTQDISPENFKMVNQPAKAAAVSVWKKDDGELVAFGRYATNIRPGALGISWTNTQFAKETGYSSDDKVTQSENLALKPSDIFQDEKPVPAAELLKKARNLPDGVPEELREIIPAMLEAVARGDETYVPEADKHRQIIEKYVGEYAAALAILTGNFLSGDVEAAEQELLAPQGRSWADMELMQFPTSVVQALVDSYVMTGDRKVRIAVSSKANKGSGAAASVMSVSKILKEKIDAFAPELLNSHKELIQGIHLIADNPAKEGVYKAGKLYGFVTDNDIKVIEYFIKSFDKDEKMMTGNLKKIARSFPAQSEVEKMQKHPNYNIGYRLLAGLARKVADHLNAMNPTDLFKAVLAKSAMVQVYAKTQKKGDALAFTDFRMVFPPVFDGHIYFDARTNFYSTDKPKGRMTFKLKR